MRAGWFALPFHSLHIVPALFIGIEMARERQDTVEGVHLYNVLRKFVKNPVWIQEKVEFSAIDAAYAWSDWYIITIG